MGKQTELEKQLNDFSEEIKALGKKIEAAFEEKHHGKRHTGVLWPFIASIFSMFALLIAVWILNFAGTVTEIGFLINLGAFISRNLGLLFAMALFSGFRVYLHEEYRGAVMMFYPVMVAIEIVLALWVGARFLEIANADINNAVIAVFLELLGWGLWKLFIALAFFGYFLLIVRFIAYGGKHMVKKTKRVSKKGVRRLYRSGKDRILGGVCGGIGEYLGVDPVVVRLLWVLSSFWGVGILAYIVAWIIIPRNPKHKWD